MPDSQAETIAALQDRARTIRRHVIRLLGNSIGGHYGGSLSAADVLAVLYFDVMNYRPTEPEWPVRDRFILSKGHAAVAYCSALAQAGFYPLEELFETYNTLGSPYAMHCDMTRIPGCDFSAGALGHGLSVGVGLALAARITGRPSRVFVLTGDADMQEGSTWEAALSAAQYQLGNLCCIVDRNRCGSDGRTEELMALEPVREKWSAFNWETIAIDGHDAAQIRAALQDLPSGAGRPRMVLAETIKGKGVSFMEDRPEWHYGVCTPEQTEAALNELGG